jgi:hypothetical protein
MFIWMGDERKAMEVARKISSTTQILKPESIIGCAPVDQKISKDRCRLSGMHEVVQCRMRPQVLSDVILTALGAHD